MQLNDQGEKKGGEGERIVTKEQISNFLRFNSIFVHQ